MIAKISGFIEKNSDIIRKSITNNKFKLAIFSVILVTLATFILSYFSKDGLEMTHVIAIPLLYSLVICSLLTARKNYKRAILSVFIISALFQMYLAAQFIGVEHDINVQYNAAVAFEEGKDTYKVVNPYYAKPIHREITRFYRPNYEEVANIIDFYGHPSRIYLSYAVYKISQWMSVYFSTLIKYPMIIASLVIAFLMRKILRIHKRNDKKIYNSIALYLFNPLTIMVSGYHGQVDNLGIIFLMLFLYLMLKRQKVSILNDLIFGFSLVIKPVTAAIVPYLMLRRRKIFKMGLFLFTISIPFAALLFTYKFLTAQIALKYVLLYGGVRYLWSYSRIEQYLTTTFNLPEVHEAFVYIYIAITVLMFLFMLYYFYKNKNIGYIDGIIISYFIFYAIHSGFGIQYLLWSLPFMALKSIENVQFRNLVYIFSIIGLFFGLTFYYGNANAYYIIRDLIGYSLIGFAYWIFIVFMLLWYIKIGIKNQPVKAL
ncbi:DUF2029 domain-containing protein [Candidatus Woesearchaeota archaeon]|nr:DUF2029 domain-containing protein [Candidatus Woesearchaeota archaeon]